MEQQLNELERDLKIRNYSPKTIKSYLFALKKYFSFKKQSLEILDQENITSFLAYCEQNSISAQSRNLFLNAIKYYYHYIVCNHQKIQIKSAKTPKSLPTVLSRNEINRIISSIQNQKHHLLLSLSYGAGLRVSEVTTLRVQDLDLDEMTIHLKKAKGQKDRVIVLSAKIILELRNFIANKTGKDFVFTSERGGGLSTRTIQKIFQNALAKADIKKSATFHSLRHSFATHLLENRVDVRFAQELLGHQNIRTTQQYTQVTNPQLKNIQSPL